MLTFRIITGETGLLLLPEGVPAFEAYYEMSKLWPAASLARRRAILGPSG